MKNKILIIVILILTMILGNSCVQKKNNTINYIGFKFENYFTTPYKEVTVEMIKLSNKTQVNVHTEMLNNDKEREFAKIDTSFNIETKRFNELYKKVIQLKNFDYSEAFMDGLDGNDCTIEYGTHGSTISYKFWSPDGLTKMRNLNYFLELCKEFIMIGNLDSKYMFVNSPPLTLIQNSTSKR